MLIGASAVLMIVISGSQMKGAGAMIWYIIALAVPTLYALDYILIAARLPEHLDYSLMAGIMMTISALTTLPLVLWSGDLAGTGDVIANSSLLMIILMMGAITALANALTFILTKSAGAVFASQCSYATTFFGIAWSFILLQEQLDLWAWIALAMVILGLVIVGPRKAAEPATARGSQSRSPSRLQPHRLRGEQFRDQGIGKAALARDGEEVLADALEPCHLDKKAGGEFVAHDDRRDHGKPHVLAREKPQHGHVVGLGRDQGGKRPAAPSAHRRRTAGRCPAPAEPGSRGAEAPRGSRRPRGPAFR